MNIKTICYAAACAGFSIFATTSGAQSLSMSYKLDVRAEPTQVQPAIVSPCAGFNWVTAIEACGRDLLARGREVATVAAPELPSLGTIANEARVRAASVRDALIGNGRNPEMNFKFGQKTRYKASEDPAWDHRFTDFNYESYMKTNGHKAVGVELTVPFQ